MADIPQSHAPGPTLDAPDITPRPRRAAWRQRLVEAEGGLKLFLRGDSTIYSRLFIAIAVCLMALVVRLTVVEWALVMGCLFGTLVVELLHASVRELAAASGTEPVSGLPAVRLSAAATLIANCGATVCVALVLASRLWRLFAH